MTEYEYTEIKEDLENLIKDIAILSKKEPSRELSIAITNLQTGAMWFNRDFYTKKDKE